MSTPPPTPPPSLRLSTPRYCRCGRELVPRIERKRHVDRYTGEPVVEHDLVCPRFVPQWRNLWLGGLAHDGWWGDEHGIVGRYEWR